MSQEATQHRCEVHYFGSVQGVGFRYTVRRVASRFAVTGFVKNLSDGRVQLVAEGATDEVRRFLETVDAEMGHYIVGKQERSAAATGRFPSFDIRF